MRHTASNYQDAWNAWTGLRTAVGSGTNADVKLAQRGVERTGNQSKAWGEHLISLARPYLSAKEWEDLADERSGIVDQALAASPSP